MEKQVDGIVMIGGRLDLSKPDESLVREVEEAAKRVPVLMINGNLPNTKIHRVAVDQRLGAELAAQHLIDLGHRDIAVIGGFVHMSIRSSGFKDSDGYAKQRSGGP